MHYINLRFIYLLTHLLVAAHNINSFSLIFEAQQILPDRNANAKLIFVPDAAHFDA